MKGLVDDISTIIGVTSENWGADCLNGQTTFQILVPQAGSFGSTLQFVVCEGVTLCTHEPWSSNSVELHVGMERVASLKVATHEGGGASFSVFIERERPHLMQPLVEFYAKAPQLGIFSSLQAGVWADHDKIGGQINSSWSSHWHEFLRLVKEGAREDILSRYEEAGRKLKEHLDWLMTTEN